VPGAAGTWKDLTDNVNQLAANLTTQVRAISEVASAVTKGDLTRTIDVGAEGEVLSLKDTINQMIANLKDTTHTNKEQDWLKTNLAKFSQMMQGQRSLESLAQLIMSELTPLVSAQHGTFFLTEVEEPNQKPILRLLSSYALTHRKSLSNRFKLGEGLVGQCALERKTILIDDVPDDYVRISSSVGEATPRNILVLPVLFEGQIKGVIELASFQRFNPIHIVFLEQVMLSIGVVFNMITASMRTEELLEELKGSNVELGKRTNELEEKASLLEEKNREIAQASASLEEKASQLALVSKYKSEFLANMSHELRTPLNSLLILARLLADNNENNLTAKQVEYARTIDSAGNDLLALISQILDLSKIEAGKLEIETSRVALSDVSNFVHTTFAQVAAQKGLEFSVRVSRDAPATITSDVQRVQQILKNLLSNGFKFTEKGVVELRVDRVQGGMRFRSEALNRARGVLAFAVSDTGIGIAEDKQQVIFEAFHQADASTSRMYGGTGLGLTISRELARLLGGEISVKSEPGSGSIFTLYLPLGSHDLETSYQDEAGKAPHAGWVPELAASAESMVDLAGKKVLLIDDDGRNLFAVTSLLERGGICVVSASSAQEGIDALAEHPDIEVVLMDIMLPGMDGYQATHKIRSMYAYATLPIVALTAKAMPGDREKCLDAGCSDFVPKPVDGDQLIAVIKRALAK
jgi:signal transduction histidine kinase/ActR/RegA family two-component response regulator/HAMP domain-containing protein